MQQPFTWTEAQAAYSPKTLRRLVDGGFVDRLYHGVYLEHGSSLDAVAAIRAALLAVGDDKIVIRESAAIVHGFGVLPAPQVQLAAPPPVPRSQPGFLVHACEIPDRDLTKTDRMIVTTPARTVVDLARQTSRLDAIATADAALRAGLCTPDELVDQLARQGRARGIVQARDIVRLADGRAESPMESRLRLRVVDGKLPSPEVQYWVRDENGRPIYRLDLAWPEYLVGLEYDGIDHLDKPRQRSDLERRGWLLEQGWRLLSVTDTDVYRTYGRMLDRVRSFLPPPLS